MSDITLAFATSCGTLKSARGFASKKLSPSIILKSSAISIIILNIAIYPPTTSTESIEEVIDFPSSSSSFAVIGGGSVFSSILRPRYKSPLTSAPNAWHKNNTYPALGDESIRVPTVPTTKSGPEVEVKEHTFLQFSIEKLPFS